MCKLLIIFVVIYHCYCLSCLLSACRRQVDIHRGIACKESDARRAPLRFTLHATHYVRTSKNVREMKCISYIYIILGRCPFLMLLETGKWITHVVNCIFKFDVHGVMKCVPNLKANLRNYTGNVNMSRLTKLWHLLPSVNSIFKHACAAIHWGYTSDFWSDSSDPTNHRPLWQRIRLISFLSL